MGLINNDKLYPKDILISLGDMVIGSDEDKNGETKNYNLGGVYDLINTLNGKKAASYRYSSDDPDTTVGVFNITGNTFKFNEKDAREIDNTAFFNVLKNNKELVLLSLKIGVNEFNYFKITNVTQNLNSFSFELVALGTTNVNSFLLDENYNMSIDIVGSGQAQIQSDWNQADALQKDFIKNKPVVPGNQNLESVLTEGNTSTKGITLTGKQGFTSSGGGGLFTAVLDKGRLTILNPDNIAEFSALGMSLTDANRTWSVAITSTGSATGAANYQLRRGITGILATTDDIVQSDWNQADSNQKDFIKNKPVVGGGSDLSITKNITSTQLKANFPSTPVIDIIPSPGVGKYLKIKEIYAIYNQGSVNYNPGTSIIKIGSRVIQDQYTYSEEPISGNKTVVRIDFKNSVQQIEQNTALTFQTVSGNVTGDGDIDFEVKYEEITL